MAKERFECARGAGGQLAGPPLPSLVFGMYGNMLVADKKMHQAVPPSAEEP
jgi:hypothetical protein